jgi:hypothetical protein
LVDAGSYPNHSLRYAIHQLTNTQGMVAAKPHQRGNVKSATSPSSVKLIQKTFFSMTRL